MQSFSKLGSDFTNLILPTFIMIQANFLLVQIAQVFFTAVQDLACTFY